MLTLQALTVRYAGTTAVNEVDLRVDDGQVLALLGPSGCGKSTLLRAVAGLEPVAGGSISWDGRDLAGVPVHRRGFGLMFQDGVLFPHRTVAGNVSYGLARYGHGRADRATRVADLLELVGLAGYGERAVATLSGGEQQRVALARALAPAPRLLLLDEPLAALDRALRDRLLADLRDVLGATGTTALFVTHDQGEAFAVADVVALMDAGRIRQTGAPGARLAPSRRRMGGPVRRLHLDPAGPAGRRHRGHRRGIHARKGVLGRPTAGRPAGRRRREDPRQLPRRGAGSGGIAGDRGGARGRRGAGRRPG